MSANEYGRIVQDEWIKTAEMRRDVVSGEFVIMPNHFHGILRIIEHSKQVGDREKGDLPVALAIAHHFLKYRHGSRMLATVRDENISKGVILIPGPPLFTKLIIGDMEKYRGQSCLPAVLTL